MEGKYATFSLPPYFLTNDRENIELKHMLKHKFSDLFISSGFGSHPFYSPANYASQWPFLTEEMKMEEGWDSLYEAAAEVARFKMNAFLRLIINRGLPGAPRHACASTPSSLSHLHNLCYDQELEWTHNSNSLGKWQEKEINYPCCRHHQHQRRGCGGVVRPSVMTSQPHNHHRHTSSGPHMRDLYQAGARAVELTVAGMKRRSTGTGVFLPRTVSTSAPRKHLKDYFIQNGSHQPRVIHTLNSGMQEANLNSQSQIGSFGYPNEHEVMIAKKSAILEHQKTVNARAAMAGRSHEICLPNDWTY